MITAQPFISKREILEAYRPGREAASTLFRSLKMNGFVSDGLSAALQGQAGRMRGSLHLYCALNKDAARLARLGHGVEARRLATISAQIEQSAPARRVVTSLLEAVQAHVGTPETTDEALSDAFRTLVSERRDLWRALSTLGQRIERTRDQAAAPELVDRFFGVVSALAPDGTAEVVEERGRRRVMLPAAELAERGLDREGEAVAILWEHFGRGRVLTEAEPALRLEPSTRPFLSSRLDLPPDLLASMRGEGPTVEIRQPVLRS